MPSFTILLLAGGQSDEHDVSLLSARNVAAGLCAAGHTVRPSVITRQGRLLGEADSEQAIASGRSQATGEPLLRALGERLANIDLVFPILHGPMGEDGTIQGLLRLVGVPFVGSGVLGSALSMDKPMTKMVLAAAGLPQVAYELCVRADFARNEDALVARIAAKVPPPWFVKPANLGSSVGIAKVTAQAGLKAALTAAFAYDRRAIVEAGVERVRELEVAVLGNDEPQAAVLGEITYDADFYDYETKYTDGRSRMIIPANVPAEVQERCRSLACQTFAALDCAGLARVDFFYRPADGQLFVNEVNTMPGFTKFSMFPSMWQAAGHSLTAVLDRLVHLALARAAGAQEAVSPE